MTDKPQQVILGPGAKGYFDGMTRLMCKDAPPAPEDAPMLAKIAKVGSSPATSSIWTRSAHLCRTHPPTCRGPSSRRRDGLVNQRT